MSLELSLVVRTSVLLMFAALLAAALRRRSASVRHSIWAIGLCTSLAMPLAYFVLPALNLPLLPNAGDEALQVAPSGSLATVESIESELPRAAPSSLVQFRTPSPSDPQAGLWSLRQWLMLIWGLGTMTVLGRWFVAIREVRTLRRGSHVLDNPRCSNILSELRRALSVSNPVQLRIGGDAIPPMTWGLVRHVILLPSCAIDWTAERIRLVIAHELAHIKRREGVTQLLILAACSLYWFNPLVWIAAYFMRNERERACDDRVLNLGVDADDYADHLLQIARAVGARRPLSALAMAHPSNLEARLRAILSERENRRTAGRLATAAGVCLAAFLTSLIATVHLTAMTLLPLPPVPSSAPRAPEPVHSSPLLEAPAGLAPQAAGRATSPLRPWLDPDVVYIITDQEKNAFGELKTDEERQRFIEQFWLRRDPTPGTPENEFQEEYYRRLAYANARFGWSKAGWESDRGRTYIRFGPPDQLDPHPAGGTYERPATAGGGTVSTYPFEVWTYRYLQGIGNNVALEFVDPAQNGEYRLSRDPAAEKVADLAAVPAIPSPSVSISSSGTAAQVLPFEIRTDYIRLSEGSMLAPITFQIKYKDLAFVKGPGAQSCQVEVSGKITAGDSGRFIFKFDEVINNVFPDGTFSRALESEALFQKTVPLRPGDYVLEVMVKDVNSGVMGLRTVALMVPPIPDQALATSSLILASRITPVAGPLGQFVLGTDKVVPSVTNRVKPDQNLDVWLQVYGLKLDGATQRASTTFVVSIQENSSLFTVGVPPGSLQNISPSGTQATFTQRLPVASLRPGEYTIRVKVTDNISGESVTAISPLTVQ